MIKIFNEIISTIYCKYIHITKKVNNDNFKCNCSSCEYFKDCDKSRYTYLLDELFRLNCLYIDILFKDPDDDSQLMELSYQANVIVRMLKYYDESEE